MITYEVTPEFYRDFLVGTGMAFANNLAALYYAWYDSLIF